MKFAYLLLCLIPFGAQADIYKAVDADGHVTYSSAPIKGGKRVVFTPANETAHERPGDAGRDFPKVNGETQKERDGARRKILDDELKAEEGLLSIAKQTLKTEEAVQPKNQEKINTVTRQVELHQGNIDALKSEISKLK